jgi:hypothetical protein
VFESVNWGYVVLWHQTEIVDSIPDITLRELAEALP